MENISKLFVVLGIKHMNKTFHYARLKLAIVYTLVSVVLFLLFSGGIYGVFVNVMPFPPHLPAEVLVLEASPHDIELRIQHEVNENLRETLLIANVLFVFLSFSISYTVAGKVLAPIELSYERQKRFISDAAHELRTPLAVMKTAIESSLASGTYPRDTRVLLDDLHGEANFMSQITEDLLLLARADAQVLPQPNMPVALCELSRTVLESLRPYAKEKEVSLHEVYEKDVTIMGDSFELKRLLHNLLKNAIDYNTPEGSVTLSLSQKLNDIVLSVTDTGIGIDPQDLPHIFERFYKADEARVRGSEGGGLGLSIVKEIAERHDATIAVESTSGIGTTIVVTFRNAAKNIS